MDIMKTNGIIYENGLPTTTNGGWFQTIAYLLDLINKTNIDNKESLIQSIENLKSIYDCSANTQTINVIEIKHLPRETKIELYNPHQISNCSPIINYRTESVKPAPLVIKTPVSNLYRKCCGEATPGKARGYKLSYADCVKKVDECYRRLTAFKGSVNQGDFGKVKMEQPDCGCKGLPL